MTARARWALAVVPMLAMTTSCGRSTITLTGIVTTNDVIVSSQVQGQLEALLVSEGDRVSKGQLLGSVAPAELRADSAYYAHSAQGMSAAVTQAEAMVRWQTQQTADQISQAVAAAAAAVAQQAAVAAEVEMADLTFNRVERLATDGLDTPQQLDQTRTALAAAKARLEAATKQADAARSAVGLARANGEQNAIRQSQLAGSRQSAAAALAQGTKAGVRLGYTELRAPTDGVVDVRATRQGELVTVGQPVLTLIDPDDLWIRADVEESYVDRAKLGDSITVRFPSGDERRGKIVYRGADLAFATRRDVSRTKRDIKTFELRVKVDNRDRRLAVGMTGYVLLPVR